MEAHFETFILQVTSAASVAEEETIQSLWSGYGKIVRYNVHEGIVPSVVVKQIQLSTKENHPRGWNTSISHERKVKSYEVETQWYKNFNAACDENCRTPKCFGITEHKGNLVIVLEDLNAAGFPIRKERVTLKEIKACLSWLAHFHATFMTFKPEGLWAIGTYWHLATRPDELKVLDDAQLKASAPVIDQMLNDSSFQTLVHGDAKLANFCVAKNTLGEVQKNKPLVSAVDFQYVGGGCGMKDLVYFLGSCLNEQECETHEKEFLDYYFKVLKTALKSREKSGDNLDVKALEKEWRELYPFAWTDFHRFLKGWSPGHWKLTSYSERLAKQVLDQIEKNKGE